MVRSNKPLSLLQQEINLNQRFPGSQVIRFRNEYLIWTYNLLPKPLSQTYTIQLHYDQIEGIKVFVVKPMPLPLAKRKKNLPHVYSTKAQLLCLFYPDGKEWNESMLYTRTIIPWTCEWLCHYEIWVGTGVWHGSSSNHEASNEDID